LLYLPNWIAARVVRLRDPNLHEFDSFGIRWHLAMPNWWPFRKSCRAAPSAQAGFRFD